MSSGGCVTSHRSVICLSNTTCSTMLSTTFLLRKKRSGLRLHSQLVSAILSQLERLPLTCNKGNIAIGNLHLFLPAILKVAEQDPSKRLLSLHALKEVVYRPFLRVDRLLKISFFAGCNALLSRTIGACCRRYLDSSFPQFYFRLGRIDSKCCCGMPRQAHNYTPITLPPPTPRMYTR